MDHEQLQAPSRAELKQMLEYQQQQIKKLCAVQTQLRARVAELEEQLAEEAAEKRIQEEERATRDALGHLDDVEYLAKSKLAEMVVNIHGRSRTGQSLKQSLVRAIRSMKKEGASYQVPSGRYHDVLRLTYMEKKKKAEEVASVVEISERQYYRDLKAAIHRVADQILTSQDED